MIPVKEVMTRNVISFREDTPVEEIAAILSSKHITGAPVADTRAAGLVSLKAQSFTESVIREMTRLNLAMHGPQKAVNFAQGFPDFETDARILDAAARALREGYNQYATTWGAPQLRNAVAAKQSATWGR